MSRIGKKPVIIPEKVKVEQKDRIVKVAGPLGELQLNFPEPLKLEIEPSRVVVVNPEPQSSKAKQLHGTIRALIANMVLGVKDGYQKKMQVFGTGYNVKMAGDKLVIQVGFANLLEVKIPKGVKVNIDNPAAKGDESPAVFTVSGPDKALVGQFAADVRKLSPPEPYKGKGIRYADEHVRRKVGKAFTTGTA
jgi:large subunit ribosomal protein L6